MRPRGEVYSLLKGTQNFMAIVGRAVPWVLRLKNREKARERLYRSVCAPLTKGTASNSNGVEGHENEKRGMLLLFTPFNKLSLSDRDYL